MWVRYKDKKAEKQKKKEEAAAAKKNRFGAKKRKPAAAAPTPAASTVSPAKTLPTNVKSNSLVTPAGLNATLPSPEMQKHSTVSPAMGGTMQNDDDNLID